MTNFTSPDSNIWFRRRCRLRAPPILKANMPGPIPQERKSARSPNPQSSCGLCTQVPPKIGHATQHAIYLAIRRAICQEGAVKGERAERPKDRRRARDPASAPCGHPPSSATMPSMIRMRLRHVGLRREPLSAFPPFRLPVTPLAWVALVLVLALAGAALDLTIGFRQLARLRDFPPRSNDGAAL